MRPASLHVRRQLYAWLRKIYDTLTEGATRSYRRNLRPTAVF
jgi:hypothetical protein